MESYLLQDFGNGTVLIFGVRIKNIQKTKILSSF